MWNYLLQTVVLQFVFFLVYELFFRKETFFTANRWFLLLSIPVSLFLPFISISSIENLEAFKNVVRLSEINLSLTEVSSNSTFINQLQKVMSNDNFWYAFTALGSVIVLAFLLLKLKKIKQIVNRNICHKREMYTEVELQNSTNAFSFLNYIFMGNLISSKEKGMILEHEKIHVKEKHSHDLICFEILKVILWFNPFVYIFQNRLKEVHEFIADSKSVKTQKKSYANLLINQLFQTENLSFTNTFYKKSLTQNRLIMLSKSKSQKNKLVKYAMLLPLLLMMVVYNSCSNYEKEEVVKGTETPISNSEIVEVEIQDDISFKNIDQAPLFPNCESDKSKACFSREISSLVNKNFNIDLASDLDLKGEVKIRSMFIIDKKGVIQDIKVRAPHPELEAEAKRVLSLMPQLKPAIHNGKPSSLKYILPIKFKIK